MHEPGVQNRSSACGVRIPMPRSFSAPLRGVQPRRASRELKVERAPDGDHRCERRNQVEVLAASWFWILVAVERGNVRLKSDPTT